MTQRCFHYSFQMPNPWTNSELVEWERRLQEDFSRSTVAEFFSGLPEETHPKFYPQIKILFNINKIELRNKTVKQLFEDGTPTTEYEASIDRIRFAAFYFLAMKSRRKNNIRDFAKWVDIGNDEYQDRDMYKYLESVLHRKRKEYPEAIDKCRPIVKNHPENWPMAVGLAHNIVYGIEKGLVRSTKHETLAQEAIESIEAAITEKPEYGKPYLIKARALAINGRFEEALDEVDRSIHLEDSKKEDYAERIADRYFHRMRIEVEQQKYELDRATGEVQERINNIQSRFVQLLGFFAAILAVVFTSTQIAVSLQPTAAVGLILVLMGGLICGFASMSLLLPGNLDITRVVSVIVLGVIGVTGGIYLVVW